MDEPSLDSKIIFFSILTDGLSPAELGRVWRLQSGGVSKALEELQLHGLISDLVTPTATDPVTPTAKGRSLQAFLWAHTDLSLVDAFAVPDHRVRAVARVELAKQEGSGRLIIWLD